MKKMNESMKTVIDNGDYNPLEDGETPETLEEQGYDDPENGVEFYKDSLDVMGCLW